MSYYYDNQTREQAETLMEQQHYPVFDEDASEKPRCIECDEPLDEDGDCRNPDCDNWIFYETGELKP